MGVCAAWVANVATKYIRDDIHTIKGCEAAHSTQQFSQIRGVDCTDVPTSFINGIFDLLHLDLRAPERTFPHPVHSRIHPSERRD